MRFDRDEIRLLTKCREHSTGPIEIHQDERGYYATSGYHCGEYGKTVWAALKKLHRKLRT